MGQESNQPQGDEMPRVLLESNDGNNDKRCTKILPATSAAPKYKFVMPTEFVNKHMSHLIEKEVQMLDEKGRAFLVQLIQRRNKDKYEYMLSGWKKYGEANQIREGDTVLFEMADSNTLRASVVGHGAAVPRAGKSRRKRPLVTATESDEEEEGYGGASRPPSRWLQQQQHAQQQQYHPNPGSSNGQGGYYASQGQPGYLRPQQPGLSPRPHHAQPPSRPGLQEAGQGSDPTISPFEAMAQAGAPGFDAFDAADTRGGAGVARGGRPGAAPGTSLSQLASYLPQRQGTTPADQLAAALTAVQQLELPTSELLALMQGQHSLSDMVPLPSSDLLALMQQQMMGAAPPPPGGGGEGMSSKGAGCSVPSLLPRAGSLQPSMAELAMVVNQLEKQTRGSDGTGGGGGGSGSRGQLQETAPAWEVLLQENVQLREELQLLKSKVTSMHSSTLNATRLMHQKTDPGLVAMTGVFNAMNQLEMPEISRDMHPRSKALLQEGMLDLRGHLNSVLQMVWEVRQLTDQLSKELDKEDTVSTLSKPLQGQQNGGMGRD